MTSVELHLRDPEAEEPTVHHIDDFEDQASKGSTFAMKLCWNFPFDNAERLHILLHVLHVHFSDRLEQCVRYTRPGPGERGHAHVSIERAAIAELVERQVAEIQTANALCIHACLLHEEQLKLELGGKIEQVQCLPAQMIEKHESVEAAAKAHILNNICFKLPGSPTRKRLLREEAEPEAQATGRMNAWSGGAHSKKFTSTTWPVFCEEMDEALRLAGIDDVILEGKSGQGHLGNNNSAAYRNNIERIYDAYCTLRKRGYSEQDICG